MTNDGGPLVCLNLAFPETLEEEIIDLCRASPGIPGFTIVAAAGFGDGAALKSATETVLGRARRRLLLAVAPVTATRALIDHLRNTLPAPDVTFWTLPVGESGRLT
jgi:hypothetical protein